MPPIMLDMSLDIMEEEEELEKEEEDDEENEDLLDMELDPIELDPMFMPPILDILLPCPPIRLGICIPPMPPPC